MLEPITAFDEVEMLQNLRLENQIGGHRETRVMNIKVDHNSNSYINKSSESGHSSSPNQNKQSNGKIKANVLGDVN